MAPAVRVEALFANGRTVPTVFVEGRVSGVDPGAGRVAVDSLAFTTTARTAFGGEEDFTSLDGLTAGQPLKVEATIREDGRFRAREIDVGNDDTPRSITAFVQSKQDGRFEGLGSPFRSRATPSMTSEGGSGRSA